MNEELETAKEELQSTNEELTTLNDELQSRNQEIDAGQQRPGEPLATVDIPDPDPRSRNGASGASRPRRAAS